MAVRKTKDVRKALLKKGFLAEDGDDEYFTYFRPDGSQSEVFTKLSHANSGHDIRQNLLSAMAKQVGLSNRDFLELVDCPMSRDAYDRARFPDDYEER